MYIVLKEHVLQVSEINLLILDSARYLKDLLETKTIGFNPKSLTADGDDEQHLPRCQTPSMPHHYDKPQNHILCHGNIHAYYCPISVYQREQVILRAAYKNGKRRNDKPPVLESKVKKKAGFRRKDRTLNEQKIILGNFHIDVTPLLNGETFCQFK